MPTSGTAGKFVTLRRVWKNGDHIELVCQWDCGWKPLTRIIHKPWRFYAARWYCLQSRMAPPEVTARQLLAAQKSAGSQWQVEMAGGTLRHAAIYRDRGPAILNLSDRPIRITNGMKQPSMNVLRKQFPFIYCFSG